jgi:hypothetical protein
MERFRRRAAARGRERPRRGFIATRCCCCRKACRRHRQCRRRDHRRHRSLGSRLSRQLAGPDHRHDGRMGELPASATTRTPGTTNEVSANGSATTTSCSPRKPTTSKMQIIRRLEHRGSVLVQGPPGTGKTHTIGNLIGHLLAQGKSILVTAQTAKALRVVRDKIPEMLQPLAVSVLGSDQGARQQLASSINAITERLTRDSAQDLLQKADRLAAERCRLLSESRQLTDRLRQALDNEYRQIVVGDERYTPADAARRVAAGSLSDGWIPAAGRARQRPVPGRAGAGAAVCPRHRLDDRGRPGCAPPAAGTGAIAFAAAVRADAGRATSTCSPMVDLTAGRRALATRPMRGSEVARGPRRASSPAEFSDGPAPPGVASLRDCSPASMAAASAFIFIFLLLTIYFYLLCILNLSNL